MRVGSIFSGCLGLDLGLEAAGWEVVWACENDRACRRVIERRRPELTVYPDVRDLPDDLPAVDLLAGGFPCQDLSLAGRGAGLNGDRSALWFAMADRIREIRPRLVLVENVPGLASKMGARPGESALGTVIADLAEAGYVGSGIRLRASDIGAPHGRERIFLLAADSGSAGRWEDARGAPPDEGAARGWPEDQDHISGGARASGLSPANGAAPADPGRMAWSSAGEPHGGPGESGEPGARGSEGEEEHGTPRRARDLADWGEYAPAIARWERAIGREHPRPVDDRGELVPEFVEWMMGFPEGWTEGERAADRARMLGNAVQVQCGEVVGRLLAEA